HPAHLASDRRDGLAVALRGDRKACLDDIDVQLRQLLRDLNLLLDQQVDARRLLAVPQCRVEDMDLSHPPSAPLQTTPPHCAGSLRPTRTSSGATGVP